MSTSGNRTDKYLYYAIITSPLVPHHHLNECTVEMCSLSGHIHLHPLNGMELCKVRTQISRLECSRPTPAGNLIRSPRSLSAIVASSSCRLGTFNSRDNWSKGESRWLITNCHIITLSMSHVQLWGERLIDRGRVSQSVSQSGEVRAMRGVNSRYVHGINTHYDNLMQSKINMFPFNRIKKKKAKVTRRAHYL